MIIEILLSLALFSLICMPILIFVLSDDSVHRDIMISKSEAYSRNVSDQIRWLSSSDVNGYSNRHSCEGALARYVARNRMVGNSSAGSGYGPGSGSGTGLVSKSMPPLFSITYPVGFHHDRNVITSIRSVRHNGTSYLIIGTDSASTTDTDLYVLSADASTVMGGIESGPGVVDFDISGRYLYAVERSVVQPVWRVSLDDLLGTQGSIHDLASISTSTSNPVFASTSASTSDPTSADTNEIGGIATGTITNIPIALLGALPLRIAAMQDWLFVGTDKSAFSQGELLALKRIPSVGLSGGVSIGSTTNTFSLQYGHEFGAGINDIAYTPDELLLATPNDHELIGLRLDRNQGSSPVISSDGIWSISRSFDAPGSAGNGKSLATYKRDMYLGRTVGNIEFYKLRGASDIDMATSAASTTAGAVDFSIHAAVDVNRTISQVEEVFGGSYVAMLIKTGQPALHIYEKTSSGSYALAGEAALPATPSSMTCTNESFAIGMESTTTPLAIITL